MNRKMYDKMRGYLHRYVERNHPNPYVLEFFMIYPKALKILMVSVIAMVIYLFVGSYLIEDVTFDDYSFFEIILFSFLFGLVLILLISILYAVFTSPVLWGLFRDKLSGYPLAAEKMTIEDIYICGTIDAFQQWEEDVPYIIDKLYPEEYEATPSVLFCRELAEDAAPKSSVKKQCFRFYDDTPFRFDPKKCKHIFWIMTRQKSDLLDRLIELEPTAEFEITYLKHSKILKKIAPIPGWEYADGVAELCDEISNMYP